MFVQYIKHHNKVNSSYLLGFEDATPPDICLLQCTPSDDPNALKDAYPLPHRHREVAGVNNHNVLQFTEVAGTQGADQVV